ncbi:hypothetical protein AXF42_Ash018810 [Apostasia shenzhenica]|uniref:DUF676 domain-containing protein n=1 Tax=Apostasia shenzhenica TaxID=1088818 RepID=A0A2I0B150_9ASPA|nr:hypothetical protein AXF42_Ash018810 [Apostasia shenzhenica]
MFRLIRYFVGPDPRSPPPRKLPDAKSRSPRRSVEFRQPDMLETVHEIAIYIHRFHNLDLSQKGWYQVKASLKWEDSNRECWGTPSRVVQYEAPDLTSDDILGVWKIDDTEQSFSTQPFHIKYARQDIHLSVMISFYIFIGKEEMPATSAAILKFELLYSSVGRSLEIQASCDAYTAAVHEFRIPAKALLGIHAYCPVHFDIFHSVLVDLSIHTVLLKAGTTSQKVLFQKSNGTLDVGNDVILYALSKEELLDVLFSVGSRLSFLWNAFLKFHRANRIKIIEHLCNAWALDRKTEWSIWMVHSKIKVPHRYLRSNSNDSPQRNALGKAFPRKSNDDPAQSAVACAELHRKSITQMKINNGSIQDMQIFGDPSRVPVLIIEQDIMNISVHGSGNNSSSSTSDPNDSIPEGSRVKNVPKSSVFGKKGGRVLKVVVFVHGFQGHHLDLRLIRNQWLLLDPGTECLMSEVNEDKTSEDFREMGSRLAEEVSAFLRKKIGKLSRYGGCKDIKLSFVGHSIGNIIIRTALTDRLLDPYRKNLYTFMSLSGPHLGYWYSSNSLFNSGLWLLKKLKGAQCIHQLTCSDDPDLQNTFLYKLCEQKTLENFRNIILLSSPQDGYVPYHSARIELCPAASSDHSKKAQVFLEMLNNCLDQIRAPSSKQRTFIRCDVNFDTSNQSKNLNAMIGRAAHIEFLETDTFAKFIMWSFPHLFR